MAKHDRCQACDYSEAQGSAYAGISPGKNGKVRRYGSDLFCDHCHRVTADSFTEMEMGDQVEGAKL